MAAEFAVLDRLTSNGTFNTLVASRIYPFDRPQGSGLPAVVVRSQSLDPSDTKDGVSTLDTEFVQVLFYGADIGQLINTIEAQGRTLLDRIPNGTYNGVQVQSSQLNDRDTWSEQIDNKDCFVVEHIYKVRVKR
jgi:hypothetical protein